jgi:hypothetical protein
MHRGTIIKKNESEIDRLMLKDIIDLMFLQINF